MMWCESTKLPLLSYNPILSASPSVAKPHDISPFVLMKSLNSVKFL